MTVKETFARSNPMKRYILILLCVFFSVVPAHAQTGSGNRQRALELSTAFRDAANRVLPATVKVISHLQTTEDRRAMQIQVPALKSGRSSRFPGDSAGTGILIDPHGIVLTNNHVVGKGKEIEVELPDGRKYFVAKFRHDPETDLAVLWLNVKENETLPHAVFGDSDLMDIGDWVLAIGNPFELDSTVSAGIISAKGRSIPHVSRTEFLQTDAAINRGNSGGPLINLQGEIIGINTAIASQSGGYQGIGFAIPSNNAQWVARQILEKDKVERAWTGIVGAPLTPWHANRLGVASNVGVLVEFAVQKSPAEDAGIQPDDVILSFDGQPVNAVYQLQRLTERAEFGKTHRLVLVRGGQRYAAEIEVKPLPPSAKADSSMLDPSVQSYVDNGLGLLLVQSTGAMTGRLKMGNQRGMLVLSTVPGGRGETSGLKAGMLVVKVDGKATPTRQAYLAAREAGSLSDGFDFEIIIPGGEKHKILVGLGK